MGRLIDADERVAAAREKQAFDAIDPEPRSDGGAVEWDNWPSEATDPDVLNADQRRVIQAAADPTRSFDSLRDLSRKIAPDRSLQYARTVLEKHYRVGYRSVRDDVNSASRLRTQKYSSDEVEYDNWPDSTPHPNTLNETQQAVIAAAADPARSFDSLNELSRRVTPDKHETYAKNVLGKHYPEGKRRVSADSPTTPGPERDDPPTHPMAAFDDRLGRLDATTDPTTDAEGDCLEADPDETPGLLGRTIAAVRGLL